jgi:UPF0716 family protein affecting phage T7 exclusion
MLPRHFAKVMSVAKASIELSIREMLILILVVIIAVLVILISSGFFTDIAKFFMTVPGQGKVLALS